jgi:hypothetical protein
MQCGSYGPLNILISDIALPLSAPTLHVVGVQYGSAWHLRVSPHKCMLAIPKCVRLWAFQRSLTSRRKLAALEELRCFGKIGR